MTLCVYKMCMSSLRRDSFVFLKQWIYFSAMSQFVWLNSDIIVFKEVSINLCFWSGYELAGS